MASKLHPLQAKGKYYVDQDACTCCAACVEEAPNNFVIDSEGLTSYVFHQPETAKEVAACERAVFCCPHEAIQNDGIQGQPSKYDLELAGSASEGSHRASPAGLMFSYASDSQKRYWPSTVTKVVALVILVPPVVLFVLLIIVLWLLRGALV